MREKLIELCDTNNGWVDEVPADKFADYLIANGVTIPVHCKDCTHASRDLAGNLCCGGGRVFENHFCSLGERKDNAE